MACDSPFYVPNKLYPHASLSRYVPVSCGRCPKCKRKRVNQWVFRLLQEERYALSSFFVTFTYSTHFVPITPNGFMTLRKKDMQDFFKRLREANPCVRFKYYLAGEYGENRKRPHYHAIILCSEVVSSEIFFKSWADMGEVFVGKVCGASIAYTAKYIDKDKKIPEFENDDRIKEFSLMSKGLGKKYLTEHILRYHRSDLTRNFVYNQGIKIALPRYYKDRIYDEAQKMLIAKIAAKESFKKLQLDYERYKFLYPKSDFDRDMEDARYHRHYLFYRKSNRKL